jgi:hypothetical protein
MNIGRRGIASSALLISAAFLSTVVQWTAGAASDPLAQSAVKPLGLPSWPIRAKRWALIVGVDKYADGQITGLTGSSNDAKLLADALVRYSGFPSDQVTLLASDQPPERQPTRGNILRRLSNLRQLLPQDGLLFVSFAGHGMERQNRAFLLPSDAQLSNDIELLEQTAIDVSIIKESIRRTGVKQVVLVLDACRNDPAGGRAAGDNLMTASFAHSFDFDIRNNEVVAFATLYATAVGERSYENTERRQGYFTWELVEGLKGGAANENGEVTLATLLSYVQINVPKRVLSDLGAGKVQKPYAEIGGYLADNLVISIALNSILPATPPSATNPLDKPAASPAPMEKTQPSEKRNSPTRLTPTF